MVVHNNTKQGLIVIFAFLGVLLVVVVWSMVNSARNDRAIALASLKKSMEMSYQEIITNKSDAVQETALLSSVDLMSAFCDAKAGHLKYTSFIPPEMTWIASERVRLKSTNLLCVVELGGESQLGMDANGKIRPVSKEEFEKWPHVSSLKTDEPVAKIP